MLGSQVARHLVFDLAAHDERDLVEACQTSVVDRVVEQRLTGGADGCELFGASETRTDASGHDDKCELGCHEKSA